MELNINLIIHFTFPLYLSPTILMSNNNKIIQDMVIMIHGRGKGCPMLKRN